ncbi:MAG TPA: hypothetical protein VEA40_04910 [Ramlibacter sp.]|nr:hypothetical protein [Ramlibacter sp.]
MSEWHFSWMALGLAAVFVAAALAGRRGGDEPRDVRLLAGTGAGFSLVGAALMSLHVAS